MDHFDHVKIIWFEDFIKNTDQCLQDVLTFVNLPPHTFQAIDARNVSGESRVKWITHFLKTRSGFKRFLGKFLPKKVKKNMVNKINTANVKKGAPMTEDDRKLVTSILKPDIEKLEDLLHKNLSHWYTK